MTEQVTSEDVGNLVRSLRTHADAKAIRRDLYRGLNRATKPVRSRMTDAIPEALPQRGGLAEQFKSKVGSRTTAKAGKWAGVSIRFSSRGHDMRTLTGGRIRHPVYGNRSVWVTQTAGADPERFMGAFEDQTPLMRREVERVLEDVAQKIVRGV